jgi:hypothetical protein
MGIETVNGRGLRNIQTLALRNAFGNVEHHHIAQFLQTHEMGECAADLTGPNQCYLLARHLDLSLHILNETKSCLRKRRKRPDFFA